MFGRPAAVVLLSLDARTGSRRYVPPPFPHRFIGGRCRQASSGLFRRPVCVSRHMYALNAVTERRYRSRVASRVLIIACCVHTRRTAQWKLWNSNWSCFVVVDMVIVIAIKSLQKTTEPYRRIQQVQIVRKLENRYRLLTRTSAFAEKPLS